MEVGDAGVESDQRDLEKRLEAVLFLETKAPVPSPVLARQLGCSSDELQSVIHSLNRRLADADSVLHVRSLDDGWQLALRPEYSDPVLDSYRESGKRRLSKAILETLVIVAYRQPVTKAEVEAVRGVNSALYLKQLVEDDMIRVAGRRNVPGRPVLYRTTPKFLLHFGLKSLSDLPAPQDIRSFDFLVDSEPSVEPVAPEEAVVSDETAPPTE